MPFAGPTRFRKTGQALLLAALACVAGCSIAPPRNDDPWEGFNRKAYAFNEAVDKVAIRPLAVGYRKITNDPVRRAVNDFFTNLRLPITIGNDLLQGQPKRAFRATSRFVINLTIGLGGLFDPASGIGLPLEQTDFGVTLARWGVPEGTFVMLPVFGPSTTRDFWQIPFDGYLLDPLTIYARRHPMRYHAQLIPQFTYLVNLRASAIDAEGFLQSAYDPYVFVRDAYRQRRLYRIYYGDPPADIIDAMMGLDDDDFDPDELLEEQENWAREQAAQEPAREPPAKD